MLNHVKDFRCLDLNILLCYALQLFVRFVQLLLIKYSILIEYV